MAGLKGSSRLQKAARFAQRLAGQILKNGLPRDTLLNVNVPYTSMIKGIKLTRQGKRVYDNSIQEMLDPRGRKHYWIGAGTTTWESAVDTDFQAVQNSFISVSPMHLDLTNYKALNYMKNNWEFADKEKVKVKVRVKVRKPVWSMTRLRLVE